MFIKLGPNRREVPVAVLVPNMVTTLALCSGLASLHFILSERWTHALAAIFAAAIFDVLDGGAARLLRVSSKFGAVLDSLSDFLAFGVAPAMLLHQWILLPKTTRVIDTFSLVAVMVFAVCSALRLARFTSAIGNPTPATPKPATKHKARVFFVGMPTPAAAGAVLVPAYLQASVQSGNTLNLNLTKLPEWAIAIYTLAIALLMVSRIPMFALKGLKISRRSVAPVMVVLAVIAVLLLKETWLTLAGLSILYIATVPLAMWMHSKQKKETGTATT